MQTDRGPLCPSLWYRRHAQRDTLSIDDLYDGHHELGTQNTYNIIMGDMNVHEDSGLKYLRTAQAEKAND